MVKDILFSKAAASDDLKEDAGIISFGTLSPLSEK